MYTLGSTNCKTFATVGCLGSGASVYRGVCRACGAYMADRVLGN